MELIKPQDAARRLGISYPTLKQWIYRGQISSLRTPGGHHRIPSTEIERLVPQEPGAVHGISPPVSGRNQLKGTIVEVRFGGLLAQVRLDIGGQIVTSVITRGAAEELDLRVGKPAVALIKATEVMILGLPAVP